MHFSQLIICLGRRDSISTTQLVQTSSLALHPNPTVPPLPMELTQARGDFMPYTLLVTDKIVDEMLLCLSFPTHVPEEPDLMHKAQVLLGLKCVFKVKRDPTPFKT